MRTQLLTVCNVCDSPRLDVVDAECNLARCGACGYIFDNPQPTADELARYYSQAGKYDSWLTELAAREELWRRRLEKLRSTRKPGSLLDVGTGIGQFLSLARDSYTDVHGTEVSATAIEISRQRYHLNVFHGTVEELASQRKTFDNITLFHVLEHVTSPGSVLKACHAMLAPNGVLVIAVPNEVASLRGLKRRVFGARPRGRFGKMGLPRIVLDGSIDEIHLSHFTPQVLNRLVTTMGFSVVKSTLDPYYVRTGPGLWKADLFYYFCLGFLKVFRANIYDAILLVARKAHSSAS